MVYAGGTLLLVRLSVLTVFLVWFILGMLIVLVIKCATALFNPPNRRDGGIRWGIVSYTMVMFSLATVHIATKAHVLSISYIDNRDFPGVDRELYPGPFGYQAAIPYKAISIVPIASFRLSNWSADGLLVSSLFDAVVTRPDA